MQILYLLLGGIVGAIIGWLLRAQKAPMRDERIENELREQLGKRDAELVAVQNKATEESRAQQEQQRSLVARNGALEADVKNLNERLTEERGQIAALQEKFEKEFAAVSSKLLLESSTRFDQQSTASLDKLLKPLKDNLTEFKTSLDATRKETGEHSALLKDQVNRIGDEATNLSKALRGDVKVMGNWGENMLDQILEKSGLQRDIHYRRQKGAKDADDEQQRFLDVVVDLPDKRNLVIDSKVSLRNFDDWVNSADETVRAESMAKHVDSIRRHFRGLGGKRYQETLGINAPDFVLMYVPIEAAFFSAMAQEPGLFAEALEQNVVIITNSTLLATLRTVAHVWRLADQQKNAFEIADRGGKLYDKFVGFIEDLKDVGEALTTGQKAWEAASNKLHTGSGNLVRQAEQLKALGAKAAKALPAQNVERSIE
jgi:DNA recombination protein RmuC